jgi:hypothetical protein
MISARAELRIIAIIESGLPPNKVLVLTAGYGKPYMKRIQFFAKTFQDTNEPRHVTFVSNARPLFHFPLTLILRSFSTQGIHLML